MRCQQEAPVIEKDIWQRFRGEGLKVIAIGPKESSEQASIWCTQHKLTYPVMRDDEGEIYKMYGTGSVPFHILIDQDFLIRLSQEEFERDSYREIIRDTLESSPA
ncbi:MAG: TlpA family protein disulfide reductase [Candidatus Tectomicrobia bacterium]|uniref:TlpA family protein disulfide reductase n=1 Tax=Tectimicrobiota bacterium TaxID=2528274 RepID=A0A933LPT2_UNCTE|nr:TlpA family protein disulfide reductase [Candidatus Tectomicrobia bacterium]